MRFLRRHSLWRSLRRRLSAGLTLVAYLLTAFGVPLPAGAASAAACGCVSDEYCNSGGCCCTNHGKPAAEQRPIACCTGKPGCTMPCCRHDKPSAGCSHPGQSQSDTDDDAPTGGVRWVNSISALKCRGHSTLWVSAAMVLPAPMPLAALPIPHAAGHLVYADDIGVTADRIPPVPPPRPVQA